MNTSSSYSCSSLVLESRKVRGRRRERWTRTILCVFLGVAGATSLSAEPSARLVVPEAEAWTGQRLPFSIELRAEGIFSGAPSFDLPEIPKTVIIKLGSPVLSSESDGDAETFVQSHSFALFSQASGSIEFPPITARFSHKKGYTGPDFEVSVDTESATLTINRPPGSDELGFIVTTDSLSIEESWDPEPGPLGTGAVLKRTIVQRADALTGIALKQAPTPEVEGIRSYPGNPEVSDQTERGQFRGERRETITYLVQQPGLHTLPGIRYDWWNPKTEKLESKTLPAVSFTATAPPPPPPKPSPTRFLWPLAAVVGVALIYGYRRRLAHLARWIHERIDPPSKRAGRAFLRACGGGDPEECNRAWGTLRQLDHGLRISSELQSELVRLQQRIYGTPDPADPWSGQALAEAYKDSIRVPEHRTPKTQLPPLNP